MELTKTQVEQLCSTAWEDGAYRDFLDEGHARYREPEPPETFADWWRDVGGPRYDEMTRR